jgi:hypothetical protein
MLTNNGLGYTLGDFLQTHLVTLSRHIIFAINAVFLVFSS